MYSIPGGIGRYTRELISGLEKIDHENEYHIFLDQKGFEDYSPRNDNFHKVLADVKWYGWAEQMRMPFVWRKAKVDLMHFTHFNKSIFYRRPYVVTIHDLTYTMQRGLKISKLPPIVYEFKYLAYETAIRDAIKGAKKIIVPSYYSKKDIVKKYKLDENKVAVTYESITSDFSPEKNEKLFEAAKDKFGIKDKYFFYVGNASPHKNLKKLILAFDKVSKEVKDVQLVLSGKKEKFYNEIEEWIKKENLGDSRIIITNVISDEELHVLLSNSYSFVFPSLAEGFGIPPLEAMASGTPVLVSNASCMPEVCEDAALYFDPKDENDIADKMKIILNDEKLRDDLVEKGLNHIKKFSWEKMAKETLEVYEEVLKK